MRPHARPLPLGALPLGALLLGLPLLGGCRFEPLGWWDITALRLEIEGQDTIVVDDAGWMQVISDGGDYTDVLLRYDLIPTTSGTVEVYPNPDPVLFEGDWEMSGREDFTTRVVLGESTVMMVTDNTTGGQLELVSEDDVQLSVPGTWQGEGAGSGALVSCAVEMTLLR
ncbi:MAG: hypothetical protein JNM72_05630 [Deltaproteobacteria bacterium]|jgi:hypothetical protein|nr:hypothetical protein [Deltaproteobacteria bacterium]